jgi:hypothetical protein
VTILVLDPGLGPLPPYEEWLSDHDDVVLFTGAQAHIRSTRYTEVVRFADYAGTGPVCRHLRASAVPCSRCRQCSG